MSAERLNAAIYSLRGWLAAGERSGEVITIDGDVKVLLAAIPELLEALTKLSNEASALSAFELEMREVIGNTNWTVLQLRISEAKAALAKAAPH